MIYFYYYYFFFILIAFRGFFPVWFPHRWGFAKEINMLYQTYVAIFQIPVFFMSNWTRTHYLGELLL